MKNGSGNNNSSTSLSPLKKKVLASFDDRKISEKRFLSPTRSQNILLPDRYLIPVILR